MIKTIPETTQNKLKHLFQLIYPDKSDWDIFEQILKMAEETQVSLADQPKPTPLDQSDVVLITYADQFRREMEKPLHTLRDVAQRLFYPAISSIHILPFFPYTSDDGFSVADYSTVNPDFGDWQDIRALASNFRLMFDAVVNHTSVSHEWFQGFLSGDPRYQNFYITADPRDECLRLVVRPRALPLLTEFQSRKGKIFVWTTFSADQVDLNYANPRVLYKMTEVLLDYIRKGAQFIRLDAIAYLWKEIGTACIHLPQTHWIIQFWRLLFDEVAPYVRIITETNVPHQENISYFGDGHNEAHLVYNFALPPLILYTVQTQNTQYLSRWADKLDTPSDQTAFFNFLASHDGVGVNPVRGILTNLEIDQLVSRIQQIGGLVSYKANSDGTQSPYELNVNYFDAMDDPEIPCSEEVMVARFLTAHSVLLTLKGLPAIYVHSLIGSRGWKEGFNLTGVNRTINRQKLAAEEVLGEIENPASRRAKIWSGLNRMLRVRRREAAFHPFADQQVIFGDERIFSLMRFDPQSERHVFCVHNFSQDEIKVNLPDDTYRWKDLLSDVGEEFKKVVRLLPYQHRWMVRSNL
ncbi:MAG: sucrose phosphorylase [Bellilinea sp.]|nr:MAG: sucrose phosphorylase [Bellilinea sp.]